MKIKLEDKQQDFLELNINRKGEISGNSIMFSDGRLSLLGIGTRDGMEYLTLKELQDGKKPKEKNVYVYFKKTSEEDPLPWEANTLKYRVINVIK